MPRFSCVAAALILALSTIAVSAGARQQILMDSGWRFHLDTQTVLQHAASITEWRWKVDDNAPGDAASGAAAATVDSGPDWQDTTTGADTFNGRVGYNWYRATMPELSFRNRVLRFTNVDDNADVYLNGVHLVHHEGWNKRFDVPLDSAWRRNGPNVVAVAVQNTAGPGGIMGMVTLGTPGTSDNPFTVDYRDAGWRTVHLPHDYVVEQPFTEGLDAGHGSLPTPEAWYRKSFTLPASDRGSSIWIDFEGVYRDSVVYLNGHELGEHKSGYTPAVYDISSAVRFDAPNVLAVHVDPTDGEGWWYEGGGIYRHVWLNIAAPVHVAQWGVFVNSRVPDGENPSHADLSVTTTLTNATAADSAITLTSRIYTPNGTLAGSAVTRNTATTGASRDITQSVKVTAPELWSLDSPNLYTVITTLNQGAREVDRTTTPFGIRTILFDKDKGFFLNGQHVEIQGVCNHQDFAGVGIGMPDSVLAWRTKKLKEMGCNAFRSSHNMVSEELLNECDRQGMLVMDENRHLGDTYDAKSPSGTKATDLADLVEMVKRDRNHPSVIMWSMCNEEYLQGSDEGARLFKAMMDVVHKYDQTRPISCAMSGGFGSGFSNVEELQGVNYNTWIYQSYHDSHPDIPMYGSEIGSTVAARGVYVQDNAAGLVSNYPWAPSWAQTPEDTWQPMASHPYMAGGFVWTGFDYKGEPTPYNWPDINSNFGLMDECGFPKDDYYYYKAWWIDRPLVHIFPHWNWPGQEGKPIRVYCWGNTPEVELFLNGQSLGMKEMPLYRHAEWTVPYAPGTLIVKGYDATGKVAATDTVETTGASASLKLTTDRTVLKADGEDVTMVEVSVLDSQGRVVPTADDPVTFSVTGAGYVAGTGNGDPTSHQPDRGRFRNAFNGHCLVLVGANDTPGQFQLTAVAPGLKPVTLALSSRITRQK